jgi:hypothetical protein
MSRPELEVADILRRFLPAYRQAGGSLSPEQASVLSGLLACRTAALGGHIEACDECGNQRIAYNSCGNRHCPKCHAAQSAEWLGRERLRLLPVPYSHVVFTVPHLLSQVILQNRRVGYRVLFQAASQTLLQIALDPKHLGAQIGILAILHTWGQTLFFHPHLHCLVPAGGLSADQQRWVPSRNGFFLPVAVLRKLFRGKYLALLEESFHAGELRFHGQLKHLAEPPAFQRLLKQARRIKWVVYAKPPFGSSEQVLKYLARYTHRVAISNARLVRVTDQAVVFTYKDYSDGSRHKTVSLEPAEFIRRFLLHTLPKRFVRIRRYGLLANGRCESLLTRCRTLLGTPASVVATVESGVGTTLELPQQKEKICSACGKGRLRLVGILPTCRGQWSRAPPIAQTG